mmetsp:Transcript_19324/g.47419  ORF Transcript_19324/g.47419 Transcript_19324/m.47419 type:complete len:765 (+) Transcript_19324:56-2350(+)
MGSEDPWADLWPKEAPPAAAGAGASSSQGAPAQVFPEPSADLFAEFDKKMQVQTTQATADPFANFDTFGSSPNPPPAPQPAVVTTPKQEAFDPFGTGAGGVPQSAPPASAFVDADTTPAAKAIDFSQVSKSAQPAATAISDFDFEDTVPSAQKAVPAFDYFASQGQSSAPKDLFAQASRVQGSGSAEFKDADDFYDQEDGLRPAAAATGPAVAAMTPEKPSNMEAAFADRRTTQAAPAPSSSAAPAQESSAEMMARKLRVLKDLPPASCLSMLYKPPTSAGGIIPFDPVIVLRETENLSQAKLSSCRTIAQKRALLDTAVAMSNRDTLLLVILWVRETLKRELFFSEIFIRPQAVDVYANYLREAERWDELESFRLSVRVMEMRRQDSNNPSKTRTCSELALAMIYRALTKYTPEDQVVVMQEILNFAESVPRGTIWEAGELDNISEMVSQWQTLLRTQVDIERVDQSTGPPVIEQAAPGTNPLLQAPPVNVWTKYPRPNCVGLTVLETMDYVSLYHANDREDQLASPKGLRKILKVSDRLYWFAAYSALAKAGCWEIIKTAVQSKAMFSKETQYKSQIGWRPMVNLIYKWARPDRDQDLRKLAVLFAGQMEDRVDAYNLCMQIRLWEAAIQACIDLKDEDRLVELRVRIAQEPNQEDVAHYIQMIDEVYRDTRIKWKTALDTSSSKMFGSTKLAKVTGIFSLKKEISDGGITNMFKKGFNKLSGKKEPDSPTTPISVTEKFEAETKAKTQIAFGTGGGIIDDD